MKILPEKEYMKEALRQSTSDFRPGKAGRGNIMPDCIPAGICPNCGHQPYLGIVDKDYEKIALFGCFQCEWKTPISADRHGLV